MLMALRPGAHAGDRSKNTRCCARSGALAGDPILAMLVAAALTLACHSASPSCCSGDFLRHTVASPTGALASCSVGGPGRGTPRSVTPATFRPQAPCLGKPSWCAPWAWCSPLRSCPDHSCTELAGPPPGVSVKLYTWRSMSPGIGSWGQVRSSAHCLRCGSGATTPADPGPARPFSTSRPLIPPRSPLLTPPAKLCSWLTVYRMLRDALEVLRPSESHPPRRRPLIKTRIVASIRLVARFAGSRRRRHDRLSTTSARVARNRNISVVRDPTSTWSPTSSQTVGRVCSGVWQARPVALTSRSSIRRRHCTASSSRAYGSRLPVSCGRAP